MGSKVDRSAYESMEQFASDVDLIVRNCRQFNPAGTGPWQAADILEKAFRKEWSRITRKKLGGNEKKSVLSVLSKLRADDWYAFHQSERLRSQSDMTNL